MFFAKLKATLASISALVVCAGTIVYCASGQTVPAQGKPKGELEALRHENELLKINLRVTLEKIKALEGEVVALKVKSKAPIGLSPAGTSTLDYDRDGRLEWYFNGPVADGPKKAMEQALKVRPDEIDAAFNLLRDAKDAQSRQRAVEQIERVMKKLRHELNRPADPNVKQKPGSQ